LVAIRYKSYVLPGPEIPFELLLAQWRAKLVFNQELLPRFELDDEVRNAVALPMLSADAFRDFASTPEDEAAIAAECQWIAAQVERDGLRQEILAL
jgi:hypothetical protein